MLDKTAYKILEIIVAMTDNAENLVVNKAEILSLIDIDVHLTVEELDSVIEALQVNDMLTILYSDSGMYCIAVRPKGKLIAEKNKMAEEAAIAAAEAENRKESEQREKGNEANNSDKLSVLDVRRFALICAISSFLGGFVAAMITFLVTLFK